MKSLLLYFLLLFWVLETGQCCSCVPGSLNRPRNAAIRDDYCFSSMVYSARVIGANCNCVMGNTTLKCVNYTQVDSMVTAQVMTMGECEGANFISPFLNPCSTLSSSLSVNTSITQMAGLPTVNLTAMAVSGRCSNVCPFNQVDSEYPTVANPCQYTVELREIFKPFNTTMASIRTVDGPDVLTTCGNPSRRLTIGETYLVGIGGACSPISEWSTLTSFSNTELDYLRELGGSVDQTVLCGTLGNLPSVITLVLSVLLILFVAA